LVSLKEYDSGDDVLIQYIEHISDILNNFLKSMEGHPDVKWWNNILQSEKTRINCNYRSDFKIDTVLTGWLSHFYGIYGETTFEDIKPLTFCVPIELVNEFTNKKKQLQMISYFGKVCQINEHTYAPKLQISIRVQSEENITLCYPKRRQTYIENAK
jgi:hypothetical protein